ncbi:MAG: hypothetical protein K6T34_01605 [Thermoflavifilum sp.]|nr:hypothetical protein [Thermoflavifilum sp.]
MQARQPISSIDGAGAASTKTSKNRSIRRLLFRHDWVVRHLPLVLYLSVLALIYIANGHRAEKKIRKLNKLEKEVQALHWKYLEAKSEMMFQSKYSEVQRAVAPWGWQASQHPPFVLLVDTTR